MFRTDPTPSFVSSYFRFPFFILGREGEKKGLMIFLCLVGRVKLKDKRNISLPFLTVSDWLLPSDQSVDIIGNYSQNSSRKKSCVFCHPMGATRLLRHNELVGAELSVYIYIFLLFLCVCVVVLIRGRAEEFIAIAFHATLDRNGWFSWPLSRRLPRHSLASSSSLSWLPL